MSGSLGELFVAHQGHKLGNAGMVEGDLIMRALVLDRAHRGDEPHFVGAPPPPLRRTVMRSARTATGPTGGRDHVVAAEKARDELGRRLFKQVARIGRLLDAALVHHDNEIGERQRLVLAVRDMDEGNVELLLETAKLSPHANAQERIERRQAARPAAEFGDR